MVSSNEFESIPSKLSRVRCFWALFVIVFRKSIERSNERMLCDAPPVRKGRDVVFIYFMNFPLDQRFRHMHVVRFCIPWLQMVICMIWSSSPLYELESVYLLFSICVEMLRCSAFFLIPFLIALHFRCLCIYTINETKKHKHWHNTLK